MSVIARLNDRALLSCRLQNPDEFGMHIFIAADDVARRQRIVMALYSSDDAARLAHEDLAGGDIPG